MSAFPRISFGLIVLNGEPYTRYLLRAIYPFAHEIIAVEGAAPAARSIATADGHSNDGTLQVLESFQSVDDPEHKLTVVTAEDHGHANGFWPGEKDEQSQAYAKRATGDYLWQVDVDEFYQPADMRSLVELLQARPEISAVSFKQVTFWGGFDYWTDSWYLARAVNDFHRVFRWGPGFRYVTHRPPTVVDEQGRDLRALTWLTGAELERRGMRLYHYSLVFPKQVVDKCKYYGRAEWAQRHKAELWAAEVFFNLRRPYQVHNVYDYPSWLNRFSGKHPPEIDRLRADLRAGSRADGPRPTEDIERLLDSRLYRAGRYVLQHLVVLGNLVPHYLLWRGRLGSLQSDPRRALRRMFHRLLRRPLE